jgi:hypothetical protein
MERNFLVIERGIFPNKSKLITNRIKRNIRTMKKGKIIAVCTVVLALSACNSTPKPRYTDITSHPDSSFDSVMIDYLSQIELTDDVVLHFIASNRFTQRELNLREESGVGVETFISATRNKIEKRINEKPSEYSYFIGNTLNTYDAKKGYFPLVSGNEKGGLIQRFNNTFYEEKLTKGADAYRRAGALIDLTGWVLPMGEQQAYELIKSFPDRKVPTYITYKLNSCKYRPKQEEDSVMRSEYIQCQYDVTGVSYYNTSKVTDFTQPIAKASQLVK